jgi:hypothetical protein
MTVAQVRQALADACATVSGLRSAPYMPDQINPPVAVVTPGDFDPRLTLGETKSQRQFVVSVYTGRTAETAAQKLLDSYCELSGATSVIAAIQGSAGLNGATGGTYADYAEVTNVSALKVSTIGLTEYLLVDFEIEVVF